MGTLSLRLGSRLGQWIAGWREARTRRRELREVDPEVLKRSLNEAGLSWVDLRVGRPGARVDFERMLAQFGIDPKRVAPRYLAALRDAERVCMHCRDVGRCRRWFARKGRGERPHGFCPNAPVFDEIAAGGGHAEADRPRSLQA